MKYFKELFQPKFGIKKKRDPLFINPLEILKQKCGARFTNPCGKLWRVAVVISFVSPCTRK